VEPDADTDSTSSGDESDSSDGYEDADGASWPRTNEGTYAFPDLLAQRVEADAALRTAANDYAREHSTRAAAEFQNAYWRALHVYEVLEAQLRAFAQRDDHAYLVNGVRAMYWADKTAEHVAYLYSEKRHIPTLE
jgi:hypothetical protein